MKGAKLGLASVALALHQRVGIMSAPSVRVAFLSLVAACGASQEPVEPTEALVAASPRDAEGAEGVSSPSGRASPGGASTAPASQDGSTSEECRGGDLDLASLAAQGVCNLDRTAEPVPEGLRIGLRDAAISARSGDAFDVFVELENTASEPLAVELDASCSFGNLVWTEIWKRSSAIDAVGTRCEPVIGCSGHVVGVEIEPGQSAYLRLEIEARAVVQTESCERLAGRALSPGTYDLRVHTALADEPLIAELKVRR